MTYHRQVVAQIHRLGRKAEVKIRSETGQNEFGNMTDEYVPDRYVIAFQTYPNRNTQVESNVGNRGQDRPVFLVPNTDDQPDPPAEEDVLVYNGQDYEVKSHTRYDTHVEFFGEPIIHDEAGE
jgi:hypothetical protein